MIVCFDVINVFSCIYKRIIVKSKLDEAYTLCLNKNFCQFWEQNFFLEIRSSNRNPRNRQKNSWSNIRIASSINFSSYCKSTFIVATINGTSNPPLFKTLHPLNPWYTVPSWYLWIKLISVVKYILLNLSQLIIHSNGIWLTNSQCIKYLCLSLFSCIINMLASHMLDPYRATL